MDFHITSKTNISRKIAYLIEKVRQLFSKHRVNKIASSAWWRAVHTENVMRCAVRQLMLAILRTMC